MSEANSKMTRANGFKWNFQLKKTKLKMHGISLSLSPPLSLSSTHFYSFQPFWLVVVVINERLIFTDTLTTSCNSNTPLRGEEEEERKGSKYKIF